MKRVIRDWFVGILKLFRFIFWYSLAVLGLFYLLPRVGIFLEGQYESLNASVKFATVLGFFLVAMIWHVLEVRERWSNRINNHDRMKIR